MNLRLFCEMFAIWFCSTSVDAGTEKNLLCHYNSWASSRSGDGKFTMDHIDSILCTHLSYYNSATLNIETRKVTSYQTFLDEDKENFVGLKLKNPQLKVLMFLTLQLNLRNNTHIELMNNKSHVDVLVKNVIYFVGQHKFDGVFLNFLPNKKTKVGFKNFVSTMKNAFQPLSYTLAVYGNKYEREINEGYDISSLSGDVNFLILPVYNFYQSSNNPNQTDHHSPLYRRPWGNKEKTVNFTVNHWINKGFPPNKILLVIPLHGKSWTLSSNETTPPAPATGPGKYSTVNGFISYYKICEAVKFEGWQVFQDPNKTMGPYAVSPDSQNRTWVGYDDPAMAVIKSKYILSKGLGGAAVWDITLDDFLNKCGGGHNPILSAVFNTLILKDMQQRSPQYSFSIFKVNKNNLFITGGISFAIAFSIFVFFVVSIIVILIKCWIDRII